MSNAMTSSPEAVYRNGLAQGRLLLQHCEECNKHVFYARLLCPHCGSKQLTFVESKGLGTVRATTVLRGPSLPAAKYTISLIDLAEGVTMMGNVVGPTAEDIVAGTRVKIRVTPAGAIPPFVFELVL